MLKLVGDVLSHSMGQYMLFEYCFICKDIIV